MQLLLEKIKSLRKAKGLTTYKLTELAGLSANTIYNWYNKGAEPSIRALKAICPILGTTLPQLLSENDNQTMSYQETELINNFRSLSEGKREIVLNLVKEFQGKE